MSKLDFSMIRNVRVPHQQFEAIKNKAKYLIVEDRENGEVYHLFVIMVKIKQNRLRLIMWKESVVHANI